MKAFATKTVKDLHLSPDHPISVLASAYEAIENMENGREYRLRLNMISMARSVGMEIGDFRTQATLLSSVFDNNTAWDSMFCDIVALIEIRHKEEIAGARIIALLAGADLQRDIQGDLDSDEHRGPIQ